MFTLLAMLLRTKIVDRNCRLISFYNYYNVLSGQISLLSQKQAKVGFIKLYVIVGMFTVSVEYSV